MLLVVKSHVYDDDKVIFEDPSIKGSRGEISNNDLEKRWKDKDSDDTLYDRYGIAVWRNTRGKAIQHLNNVRRIK